jgi:hypothetical protein
MKKLSDMTRTELLAECKARQLPGAGGNEDLIARIEAHDEAQSAADPMLGDDDTDEPADPPAAEPAGTTDPTDADARNVTVEGGDPGPVEPHPDPNTGYVNGQYRVELPLGDRTIDDAYHLHLIGEAHAHAAAAGFRTRGGATVGHRLRYAADASGRRTVVYVVHVQNPGGPNGLRRP